MFAKFDLMTSCGLCFAKYWCNTRSYFWFGLKWCWGRQSFNNLLCQELGRLRSEYNRKDGINGVQPLLHNHTALGTLTTNPKWRCERVGDLEDSTTNKASSN